MTQAQNLTLLLGSILFCLLLVAIRKKNGKKFWRELLVFWLAFIVLFNVLNPTVNKARGHRNTETAKTR